MFISLSIYKSPGINTSVILLEYYKIRVYPNIDTFFIF